MYDELHFNLVGDVQFVLCADVDDGEFFGFSAWVVDGVEVGDIGDGGGGAKDAIEKMDEQAFVFFLSEERLKHAIDEGVDGVAEANGGQGI